MESQVFHREFDHTCFVGDMPKLHEAIATDRLNVEDLDVGLKWAILWSYTDAVAILFGASARVSERATGCLHGKDDHKILGLSVSS